MVAQTCVASNVDSFAFLRDVSGYGEFLAWSRL
jgi:hypothetical protein